MEPSLPATTTVLVDAARLAKLEAMAASVPLLQAKLKKRTHNNLESLAEYNAAHPEKVAERRRKYKEAHREELNAKQREKRRLAREARLAAPGCEATAAAVPLS